MLKQNKNPQKPCLCFIQTTALSYITKVIWGHLFTTLQITRQTPQTITPQPITSWRLFKKDINMQRPQQVVHDKAQRLKFLYSMLNNATHHPPGLSCHIITQLPFHSVLCRVATRVCDAGELHKERRIQETWEREKRRCGCFQTDPKLSQTGETRRTEVQILLSCLFLALIFTSLCGTERDWTV